MAIVGGPETLLGAERGLRRRGIRVVRIPVLRYEPVPRARLRRKVERFGPYEVVLLTSPESVRVMHHAGLLPRRPGTGVPSAVAAGPATLRALRHFGGRGSWSPSRGVGREIARWFEGRRPLRVLYPRSDRAGRGLSTRLARQGHSVLDLIAYRVLPDRRPGARAPEQLRRADRILATSPSALSFLRRVVPAEAFDRLRDRRVLLVLGERSARAARGHGFSGVRIIPLVTDRGVATFVAAEVERDG